MKYSFSFNGRSSLDFNIVVTEYPGITGGEAKYDSTAVSGRSGELVGSDKYRSNITVEVPCAVIGRYMPEYFHRVRNWLRGSGTLKFSDSPDTFFKALKTSCSGVTRGSRKHGELTASFLCEPYEYLDSGQIEYNPEDLKLNPYSLARPVYRITGEGACTLTVNGHTLTANVGQNLTIDTDRMFSYREDGTIQNTEIAGDYEELRLPPGKAEISVTEGFTLKVIPNWGYEL